MRIYLVGMPGVGKSTVGKLLAEKINYKYIDLDQYIEQQAMMFIDEIFKGYGEKYFRALETNCLKDVSKTDNIVISCGGGIIKDKLNKDYMDGLCVLISAPLDVIEKRLEQSLIERPLLASKSLNDLYDERKELYQYFKDIEVNNIDIEDTINLICKEIVDYEKGTNN